MTGPVLGVDCGPLVDAYDAALQSARDTYDAAWESALQSESAARDAALDVRGAALDVRGAALQAARVAFNAAWQSASDAFAEALLDLGDPVVAWIVRSALNDHPGCAISVLRLLPCTIATLNDHAKANQWCPLWGLYRDRAVTDLKIKDTK